jgi:NitT/TauT family transport system substrate-binding protein
LFFQSNFLRGGLLAGLLGGLATSFAAAGIELEKPEITIAVGGKGLFYYLPLTIAEQRGYFKAEGLTAEIVDFPGGAKSLQALVGGSADFAAGSFEHVVNMQAKGQAIQAVALMARYPAMVLALKPTLAARYRGPADLRGLKIGITAPGSSTHMFLNNVLARGAVKPQEVSVIGIGAGAGAVAAMRHGEIDAIAHLDPVIHQLEIAGDVQVIVDTRTEEGARQIYGGPYHAACLYAKTRFLHDNPRTAQAVVNAQVRALRWLARASPEEITAAVPPAYWGGDRAGYQAALIKNLSALSPDGALSQIGAENVLKALQTFEPFIANANIDLSKSINRKFVDQARRQTP